MAAATKDTRSLRGTADALRLESVVASDLSTRLLISDSFFLSSIFLVEVEVATGNLLDLAGGANTALVHSGKLQSDTDPFAVHNGPTENNNTVWVRAEAGGAGRRLAALLGLDKIQRQGGVPVRNLGAVYVPTGAL